MTEAMERQPLVEIDRVSKVYGVGRARVHALRQVSFAVARGTFVALMGPSGSGKTTLLHLLAGLERPTEGTLRVGGRRLEAMREAALARWRGARVGLVFQFFHLLSGLTARENVALPLALAGLGRRSRLRRADAALDLVGLLERAGHRPGALSGGEQQRVAIARAIVSDPDLVVADEPTGELDAESAEGVLGLLRVLRDEHGKTIVMATHDRRATGYVDRLHQLDKGRLIEGRPSVPTVAAVATREARA